MSITDNEIYKKLHAELEHNYATKIELREAKAELREDLAQLLTKADMREFELRLDSRLSKFEISVERTLRHSLHWTIGTLIAVGALLAAIIKL